MNVRTYAMVSLSIALLVSGAWILQVRAADPPATTSEAGSPDQPQWIWSAPYSKDRVPVGTVFFRRVFEVTDPVDAKITIACDDRYELMVNGTLVGEGAGASNFVTHDIQSHLVNGRNCLAVRAQNVKGRSAGLAARLVIHRKDGKTQVVSTGPSWKAINREFLNWTGKDFNDASWGIAQIYAPVPLQKRETAQDTTPGARPSTADTAAQPIPQTPPTRTPAATQQPSASVGPPASKTPPATATAETPTPPAADAAPATDAAPAAANAEPPRFVIKRDFRIERVIKPENTGSAIAMAFNEWGEILLGQERDGILLVQDKDKDGRPETTKTYCEKITACQGLLPLNGDVYAVGQGPEGAALYKLVDDDRDGTADQITALMKFEKDMGEHGPHGLTLGPDGWLYVIIGNHSKVAGADMHKGPHRRWYEGELVQPKYEDGGGHGVGIKAPGGTIVRCKPDGSSVETVAGGLRNSYDLAFTSAGELFTFDSDMEWDTELPWYRPTRLLHVTPGAEFGWRSGWSKWPDYYLDSVPAVLDTGRGSPTGVEVYEHHRYPVEYQGALFLADWTMGQILVVKLAPSGGTYATEMEVFIQGNPLNVTDLAVGPDGWVYFVTGGRETEGGVYRIVYTGRTPPQPKLNPIGQAIRQPQFNSAFGREQVAKIFETMGEEWGKQLTAIAAAPRNRPQDRVRAIEYLQLYGPVPTGDDVLRWSADPHPLVRAKAAMMLGLVPKSEAASARLNKLLEDPDLHVRRRACEAVVRGEHQVACEPLMAMLTINDPFITFAARRALQEQNPNRWGDAVLNSENTRVFLQGAVALLTMEAENGGDPSQPKGATKLSLDATPNMRLAESSGVVPTSGEEGLAPTWYFNGDQSRILLRCQKLMSGFLSDQDFIDLLRVMQLALARDAYDKAERHELAELLANEYPTKEPRINRELVRLLAYFDEPSALPRMMAELRGEAEDVEKVHLAFHLRFITSGWTTADRLAVLEYFEKIRAFEGAGHSVSGYIDNVTRDFVAQFEAADRAEVLAAADKWPAAALVALAALPEKLDAETVDHLAKLDAAIAGTDTKQAKRLRTGIVAVLARSGDADSMEFLRMNFDREPDRRGELAMGLAQQPAANWDLLVQALPVLEGGHAQEVLRQMAACNREPDSAEVVRQVILCGLRLGDSGGQLACQLLSKWSGQNPAGPGATTAVALEAWQKWFAEQFPDAPAAAPPTETAENKYTFEQLIAYLDGEENHGRPDRGGAVFEKAQCSKCHSFAGRGETVGPDLSTVARRFQRKEILQSLLFPSQVISDQYASKVVTTKNGLTHVGIVGAAGVDSIAVLPATGEKIVLKKSEIEDISPSPKSSMPEGLLSPLTLDEIADLFAYLQSPPEVARAISTTTSTPQVENPGAHDAPPTIAPPAPAATKAPAAPRTSVAPPTREASTPTALPSPTAPSPPVPPTRTAPPTTSAPQAPKASQRSTAPPALEGPRFAP